MSRKWDLFVGLAGVGLAIAALVIWFPRDIAGPFIEITLTGRRQPGDAFFPTILAVLLVLLGLCQAAANFGKPKALPNDLPRLGPEDVVFLCVMAGLLGICGFLTYWVGTQLAELVDGRDYRRLRDVAPYKFFGFMIGGLGLILPMIAISERRLTWRAFVFSLVFVGLLLFVFGMALPNTFMPPNAEF